MQTNRRVLFVGGWGRSGSTLLDRVLGQVPGFFSAGEVREIWDGGCLRNRPCGCDKPFLDCEFWAEVGRQAFGGWQKLDLDEILRLRYAVDRPWLVPALRISFAMPRLAADVARYVDVLDALYRAIFDVSGAEVIVDSSKIPSHAYLLRRLPWIDLRMLHLIRDSRGVAYSWQKVVTKDAGSTGHGEYLHRYGPVAASVRWLVYNGQTSGIAHRGVPYRRLRYEDLMADPRKWTQRILEFAGAERRDADLPFITDHEVRFGHNHTVDGNPIRFSTGSVQLRPDEEWRRRLSPARRAAVSLITLPGLARYGYDPFAAWRTP